MNRFEQLETYVRVVEAGSITAAANQLNIAKSAVSRRLKELETRLGVQLMTRTTRQIKLTDTGRAFYERALTLLADWKETESAVSSAKTDLSGLVKIAAPVSFGEADLGSAILDFIARHPDVDFEVDFNDRKIDLIAEGHDVAIRIGNLEDSSLIARKLAPIATVACASPEFLERNGIPTTPHDLQACLEIRYLHRLDDSWAYIGPGNLAGKIRMQSKLAGTNGTFLRDAALQGEGVLIVPSFIVYNELRRGTLIKLLPDYTWERLALYAVYPPTRHLSRRIRTFVDFLIDRYHGQPFWDNY